MMFGQYLIVGCYAVTLGTYLMGSPDEGGLLFPPSYTGWIYSSTALAGMIAPLFMGLLADRLFAAEKLMGVLHLAGSLLLAGAGLWCGHQQPRVEEAYRAAADRVEVRGQPLLDAEREFDRTGQADASFRRELDAAFADVHRSRPLAGLVDETFLVLFLILIVHAFCFVTTLTLSNVVAFRNLPDPTHSFGRVRLFGTVGWIVAGVQLELFWNVMSATPLLLAGGVSFAFGLFCFSLPYTPPAGGQRSIGAAFGLPALSMFAQRSFCALIICALGIAAVQQFYSIYTNRFLRELHAPAPAAVQTIAQVAEVGCMIAVPFAIRWLGVKKTLAIGIGGWVLRNTIFATEYLPAVIVAGLPLHGLSYTFFMIVASMHVDRQAPLNLRASAQGIYTFTTFGLGTLLGNWASGQVVQRSTVGDLVDWRAIWLAPAFASAAILAVFLALFRDPPSKPRLADQPLQT
jgi:nucleoside transporter